MLSVLLIPFSVICIFISNYLIYRESKGRFLLLSPAVLFSFFFSIFIAIGSVVLVYHPDFRLHLLSNRNLENMLFRHAFDMNFGLLLFSVGAFSVGALFKLRVSDELRSKQASSLVDSSQAVPAFWVSLCLAFFCILLLSVYLMKSGSLPIVEAVVNLLAGERSGLGSLRREATYEHATPGWLLQFSRYLLPLFCAICLVCFRKIKRPFIGFLMTTFICLASFFFLILRGERGPIINALFIFLILVSVVQPGRWSKKFIFGLATLGLSFLLVLSLVLGRSGSVDNFFMAISALFEELSYRVFVSQSQTGSYIYQLFPEAKDFMGWSIYSQNLMTYLPGAQSSFSVDLFKMVHGRDGSASHSAFAEAYAAYGSFFVYFFSFILGVIYQSATYFVLRYSMSFAIAAFFSIFCMALAGSSMGSVTGVFYGGLIAAVFAFFLLRAGMIFYSKIENSNL